MSKPTIFVTNWSSKGTRGPGVAWTIMARPRTWERGAGTVRALVPSHAMLTAVKGGTIGVGLYRADFVAHVRPAELRPGRLEAFDGDAHVEVADGDTLCCACSRDAAARGECHRTWVAELLRREGWRVMLDGRELAGVDDGWRPVLRAEEG